MRLVGDIYLVTGLVWRVPDDFSHTFEGLWGRPEGWAQVSHFSISGQSQGLSFPGGLVLQETKEEPLDMDLTYCHFHHITLVNAGLASPDSKGEKAEVTYL